MSIYTNLLLVYHGCNSNDLNITTILNGSTYEYRQVEQLLRCEVIKEIEVKELCNKAREILIEESNVQRVDAPVTV